MNYLDKKCVENKPAAWANFKADVVKGVWDADEEEE